LRRRPYDHQVKSRRLERTLVVGAVLVVAAGGLAACGSDEATGIATAEVVTADVSETVEAPATVTARSTVTISSPASGTIESVEVADGDTVRKDEVLLVIDSPQAEQNLADARQAQSEANASADIDLPQADVSAAVEQADAAAEQAFDVAQDAVDAIPDEDAQAQAQAQLDQQRAAYAASRAQALASVSDLNASVTALESAVSGALGATSGQLDRAVDAAERTVAALTVRAPSAGVVTFGASASGGSDLSSLTSELPSDLQGLASSFLGGGGGTSSGSTNAVIPGLPVSSGQQLATVTDVTGLGLEAQVDETDVLLVRPGITASIQLDAVPDASYRARVTSVGVTPTTSSRGGVSYVVRLALGRGENADGERAPRPRPGMSAVALLNVRTEQDVVAVPAASVFREDGRDQVWVVVEGVTERRTVQLGAEGSDTIAVESGLEAGETIVVSGADRVTEGQELP
jgi:multidrug efflux pump subunit AcrA (membrane-fusion protein)